MVNSSESMNFVNGFPFIFVDPCPLPSKSMMKVLGTVAGIALSPCGLPGKVLGGLIGYTCGSIIANYIHK